MSKGNEGKRTIAGSSSTVEQKRIRNRSRGADEYADWSKADASTLLGVVAAITKHGFTVQFGYKQDQSEYVIRVWGDGDAYNEYLRPTEDVTLWLEGFRLDYDLGGTRPEITTPPK